ncbi:unnamed protein product [Bursaphelenchus xylophilus]|uniref:(pine wood nematode) hypothetical protein n=1 Tax=Bursaphelenchus xylophilus TaxID=6326 RepID=A0A1I7RKC0_BURXY|nr:unnamed protein product [Bursaphelenchus xylophilus]CAG9131387.1 unnamed protein product [Bursaphelenchus xylophilus]
MHSHHHYYRFPVDFSDLLASESPARPRGHRTDSSKSLLNPKPDFFNQFEGFIDNTETTSASSLSSYRRSYHPRKWICLNLLALLILLLAGLALLYTYSRTPLTCPTQTFIDNSTRYYDEKFISEMLMNLIDSKRIRENLRWLTNDVHVAGTKTQLSLMDRIEDEYKSLGFKVKTFEYEALLSYPDESRPNSVHLWSDSEGWITISKGIGTPIGPGTKRDPLGSLWWNAYSGNGTVFAPVVYCNYGTEEDFTLLLEAGVKLKGKILLIRYGAKFRGDKVFLAEQLGAVGVLLYSDPFDFAPENPHNNMTYPDQIWLPGTDAQRGTLLRFNGDPETPTFPSKPYVHRVKQHDLKDEGFLPTIPVMPLGYNDVKSLMEHMDGVSVPWSRWSGSLPVQYKLNSTVRFRLDVNTRLERGPIKNVIAVWPGREEPDEWILLSNHVDAWSNGAIDPNSGTAVMLELARVVQQVHSSTDWRPKRSLVFCQWDAEEFGLIGSTEFVEEMQNTLADRAVGLVNVDNINGNSTLTIKAVPLMYRALSRAAGRVKQPNDLEIEKGRKTLLDSWKYHSAKGALPGDKSVPAISHPLGGSDFQPFIGSLGIPVADIRMEGAPQYTFMLYHTIYETSWTVENLVDPTGQVFRAMGQFWMEVVRDLADSRILPYDVNDYSVVISEGVFFLEKYLRTLNIDKIVKDFDQIFENLHESVLKLRNSAAKFTQMIHEISHRPELVDDSRIRRINRRLKGIEKCFLSTGNERASHRHLVFRPSWRDNLNGQMFNGVLELALELTEEEKRDDELTDQLIWEMNRIQLAVESAVHFLDLI